MAFKFYLDNQLVTQPEAGKDLITTIKRNQQFKGLVITQDVTLEWNKHNSLAAGETDAYSYIKSQFDDSICNEIPITIYDEVGPTETYLVYTGIIKIAQIELIEQPVSVKVKIQDNSFYSYIDNNRELKVDLRATQTKNKENITPIDWYSVDLFASFTGVYGSTVGILYKGYRVYDIFSFIVSVITDNKVSFASTYLSTLTYDLFIFKGQSILNPYTLFPTAPDPVFEISFTELFSEIDKAKNLYFYIDNTDPDAPVLRIENIEQTYTGTVIYNFIGIKELTTTVDSTKLYTAVSVGSNENASGTTANIYTWNNATSYYGWKIEEFFPLGQCNVASRLDLVNNYVLNNNNIMETAIGGSTSNIDDYFIIECDTVDTVGLTAQAHRYDFFGAATPPYFYNFGLNNFAKLQRHSDKFETTFGTFLGLGGNGFKALLGDDDTQDITYMTGAVTNPNFIPPGGITVDAEYVNETTSGGYDGNNNYDNTVTFEYTVPANGTYSFLHELHFEIQGLQGGQDYFTAGAIITLYDAGMVQKAQQVYFNDYYYDSFQIIDTTLVAECVAGDIVKASYSIQYTPNQAGNLQLPRLFTVIWNSFFECNGTPTGGNSIASGNRAIKKLLHSFEYDISRTDFRAIQANPTGLVLFEKDQVVRQGWIEEMNYNNETGRTKVKLISQDATS